MKSKEFLKKITVVSIDSEQEKTIVKVFKTREMNCPLYILDYKMMLNSDKEEIEEIEE